MIVGAFIQCWCVSGGGGVRVSGSVSVGGMIRRWVGVGVGWWGRWRVRVRV